MNNIKFCPYCGRELLRECGCNTEEPKKYKDRIPQEKTYYGKITLIEKTYGEEDKNNEDINYDGFSDSYHLYLKRGNCGARPLLEQIHEDCCVRELTEEEIEKRESNMGDLGKSTSACFGVPDTEVYSPKVFISYYITDKKVMPEDADKIYIRKMSGGLISDYNYYCYSEWTGDGLTQEFTVGGHDMFKEIASHEDKWLILRIKEIE